MADSTPPRDIDALLDRFIVAHHLPDAYRDTVVAYWLPLSRKLAGMFAGRTLLVGINGAQGSGKSTMSDILALLLDRQHGLRTRVLSIDDLYLTRAERARLAQTVHPLFATRGVPGTHDVRLGIDLIRRLQAANEGDTVAIPAFDKASDDRRPAADWPLHQGPVDVILFEGWCVGTPPQREAALDEPVNALEADEDAGGIWRRYVNDRLAGEYRELFAMLDYLVLLKVPDFDTVFEWRGLQEEKLRRTAPDGQGLMDRAALERFIRHYERLTRHNLEVLPERADVRFDIDHDHRVVEAHYREDGREGAA